MSLPMDTSTSVSNIRENGAGPEVTGPTNSAIDAAASPAASTAASITATDAHPAVSASAAPKDDSKDKAASTSKGDLEFIPKKNSTYKQRGYWDSRFTKEAAYDWLTSFEGVKHLLLPRIKHDQRILVIGCGNSTLSADLYGSGFRRLVNIDFSPVVIERMRTKHKDMPDMTWLVQDMLTLPTAFPAESFDVVLDKAAMDALVVDEGDPWNPKASVKRDVAALCRGVLHVLKPGGLFLQISFGQPHFRRAYLCPEQEDQDTALGHPFAWDFSYETLGEGLGYFFYVLRKHGAKASSTGADAGAEHSASGGSSSC